MLLSDSPQAGEERCQSSQTRRLIERDNGEIIDSTNPNMRINGVSSYVLSQIMKHHEKKLYLTTTGYNRSILDFGNPA